MSSTQPARANVTVAVAAPRTLASVGSNRTRAVTIGRSNHSRRDDELILQITAFLREMRAEVSRDVAEDKAVYDKAHAWCEESIPEKQAILADELAHEKA